MPNNFESGLIALSTVLGTVLLLLVIYSNRAACRRAYHIFTHTLSPSEASLPSDIASASGVTIRGADQETVSSVPLSTVSDAYATAQMEGVQNISRQDWMRGIRNNDLDRWIMPGAQSGRPEPRLSVAELVDFKTGATTAGVGDEELFEGAATRPSLSTIEEAPGGMHGASTDFVNPEELIDGDSVGDETPLTSQGHAGGIIPISLALQSNSAKQDIGSAYAMLTGQWVPNPSREECKHLCLNGGDPAYVDLCDCTGYIAPVRDLGPLERAVRA